MRRSIKTDIRRHRAKQERLGTRNICAKAKGGDMNAFPQTDLELKDPESGSGLMRVLIAEDDTATRLLLQQWVREFGFDPVLAVDGEEAWGLLRQDDALRLLIVDWQRPR